MKKIEEICAEIAADMEIEPVENQINEPYGLKMQELNIFIDDTPAISTTEMKSVLSSILIK